MILFHTLSDLAPVNCRWELHINTVGGFSEPPDLTLELRDQGRPIRIVSDAVSLDAGYQEVVNLARLVVAKYYEERTAKWKNEGV